MMQEGQQHELEQVVSRCAEQSNCQKRALVCVLFDADDRILSVGHNRCTPPDGVCARLGIVSAKATYSNAGCNSEHAEINALKQLPAGCTPVRAVVYGHQFACPSCETALHEAGIFNIEIVESGFGTGLRG